MLANREQATRFIFALLVLLCCLVGKCLCVCVCVCAPAIGQCYKDDEDPFLVSPQHRTTPLLFADHLWTSLLGLAQPKRKAQDAWASSP